VAHPIEATLDGIIERCVDCERAHAGYGGNVSMSSQTQTPPIGTQEKTDAPQQAAGEGMEHGGMKMDLTAATRVTPAQRWAMAFISLIALGAGVIYPASFTNLNLSARDVGGAIMPPGMIMLRDTPGGAMRDMSAIDPRKVGYTAPANAQGDQTLHPRVENGVKVFDLTTSVIKWSILPNKQVMAYAFNQQVPGPRIRVTEGDRVRINVTNNLPESTTVHWHGLIVPNNMDGPAFVTQAPIEPGQTFTYEYTTEQAGTYFYHTHDNADRQQTLGLYGALIIDPKDTSKTPAYDLEYVIQLQEWLERDGYTYPSMLMEGGLPNYFTINGKAFPATDTIQMKVGQKIRLRFIGTSSNFIHPMHVHGGPFKIIETDGNPIPEAAQIEKDTVNVAPGERYDVIWTAREPGKWLIHCHILHHTTNNNVEEQGGGGLTMVINVTS
jgi:FtsP/CotA-like multicopper oxidase with cupredoxin domain